MINTIEALEAYAADLKEEIAACGPRWSNEKRYLTYDLKDTNQRLRRLYGKAAA